MDKPETVHNIFEALGFEDSDEMTARANLASKIIGVIENRGLSYDAAACLVGCDALQMRQICNADLDPFSVDELSEYLVTLGQRVEIA